MAMITMSNHFKTDSELSEYLKLNIPDSEYTGVFKSKDAGRKYFNELGLSDEDQQAIDDSIPFSGGNNKDITNTNNRDYRYKVISLVGYDRGYACGYAPKLKYKRNTKNGENADILAKALNDPNGVPYYFKLVHERRIDFLQNCLDIALDAVKRGVVKSSPGAYFTGIIKAKDREAKRIKKYKEKHSDKYV